MTSCGALLLPTSKVGYRNERRLDSVANHAKHIGNSQFINTSNLFRKTHLHDIYQSCTKKKKGDPFSASRTPSVLWNGEEEVQTTTSACCVGSREMQGERLVKSCRRKC